MPTGKGRNIQVAVRILWNNCIIPALELRAAGADQADFYGSENEVDKRYSRERISIITAMMKLIEELDIDVEEIINGKQTYALLFSLEERLRGKLGA